MARYVMYCPKCGREFMDQDWDDYEVHECAEKPEQPKLTNADRIRDMSDEELEDFFKQCRWAILFKINGSVLERLAQAGGRQ